MKYGIQLYNIRDEISSPESFKAALKKVAEIGYDAVETAGYHGLSKEDFKKTLDENGLVALSCHISTNHLENELEETLSYAHFAGMKYVVLASSDLSSKASIMHTVDVLKNAQKEADKYGITILYHNHHQEFVEVDGILPMDEIKKACDLEVDTFWTYVAGLDTIQYLEDNKEQLKLVHIKDGALSTHSPCAIGEGDNDIKSIVKKAEALGHAYVIVENDDPKPNGFNDIERSLTWLKKNI